MIDTDDEIVLTDPTYIGLSNRVRLAGGVPRLAPFTQERGEWCLGGDALRSAVTSKTRALFLMSPSMPSGGVLRRDDWEGAVELAPERDLFDPAGTPTRLPQIKAEIAASGAELLTRHEPRRLRVCANPGCRFVFYDTTRNRSRRWCSSRICGNLARVGRFRERRRSRAT